MCLRAAAHNIAIRYLCNKRIIHDFRVIFEYKCKVLKNIDLWLVKLCNLIIHLYTMHFFSLGIVEII